MQPLQFLLSFTIVARVIYRVALRVGIVGQEAHIDPNLSSGWLVDNLYLGLDAKLNGVAIGTVDNPYTFDLLQRKGSDLLARIAN